MKPIFGKFNFNLLSDPEFHEDSVREELVVPLLSFLGYSASRPHKIIRSRRLIHPYVYIGTRKHPISIIPDYLLQQDDKNAWILDAKSPGEEIASGKNVEQAYSYAIHKEVRVPIYALCNGRRLVVFHISQWPALLDIPLPEIDRHLGSLLELLGTKATWIDGLRPDFRPDFGLAMLKMGLSHVEGKKVQQLFLAVRVIAIAKLKDAEYSLSAACGTQEEGEFMLSFDFSFAVFEQLLSELSPERAEGVKTSLTRQPYYIHFPEEDSFTIGVLAEIGNAVHTNEDESYCPFMASRFIGPEDSVPADE